MKKTLLAKFAALAMALTMVFSLTGCDAKTAIEFVNNTNQIIENVSAEQPVFEEALNTFVAQINDDPASADTTALVESITKIEAEYKKLGELEPPKKYADAKPLLEEASQKGLEAFGIYKTEFQNFDGTNIDEAGFQTFVDNLTQGDALMQEVQSLLTQVDTILGTE